MDILEILKISGTGSIGLITLCYLHFMVTPSIKKTEDQLNKITQDIESLKTNVNGLHIDVNKTKHDCEKECMKMNNELMKHILDKKAHE